MPAGPGAAGGRIRSANTARRIRRLPQFRQSLSGTPPGLVGVFLTPGHREHLFEHRPCGIALASASRAKPNSTRCAGSCGENSVTRMSWRTASAAQTAPVRRGKKGAVGGWRASAKLRLRCGHGCELARCHGKDLCTAEPSG